VLVAGIGLGLSFLEHTRPLRAFRDDAQHFGKGKIEQLTASKFRGVYRQIAASLNEGMEHVAAKGGAPRRAADLDAVLGPMPAQPSMSAFSLPQSSIGSPLDPVKPPRRRLRAPRARPLPRPPPRRSRSYPRLPPPRRPRPPIRRPSCGSSDAASWHPNASRGTPSRRRGARGGAPAATTPGVPVPGAPGAREPPCVHRPRNSHP
jgi:hypothetical protein